MCGVQVYTGKGDDREGGLGQRVVLDLARKLEGKKYHLYFDNFFCSVSLLTKLLQRGASVCLQNHQAELQGVSHKAEDERKGKRKMENHGLFNR